MCIEASLDGRKASEHREHICIRKNRQKAPKKKKKDYSEYVRLIKK